MTRQEDVAPKPGDAGQAKRHTNRMVLGFGLFFIFFVFYMGTAIINTPAFKDVAAVSVIGMPLGMALSLAVFPLSWIIMFVYIFKWR